MDKFPIGIKCPSEADDCGISRDIFILPVFYVCLVLSFICIFQMNLVAVVAVSTDNRV